MKSQKPTDQSNRSNLLSTNKQSAKHFGLVPILKNIYFFYIRPIYRKWQYREHHQLAPILAINWLKNNLASSGGIRISSQNHTPYPEVTGYIIPTLYQWGEKSLAVKLARWLIDQQNDDGSFSAPDGTPYTFDTGQALRGLLTVRDDIPGAKQAVIKACDYILSQIKPTGEITTPSQEMWNNVTDDRIHLYILPPFQQAGEFLHDQRYITASNLALNFYKQRIDLIKFNTLSHFYAYIIDALCDLGEIELVQTAMAQLVQLQNKNGSVPAYPDKHWICSVGLAQLALIWYKLGQIDKANRAMNYLEKNQDSTGGFYGSYGRGASYFPHAEISWANKYFLDAYAWKIKTTFNNQANYFPEDISSSDNRLQEILAFLGNLNRQKVLDVGCGKGRFLRALQTKYPDGEYFGLDVSEAMLKYCPSYVRTSCDSILCTPYSDNYFDSIICVETLEHAINIDLAIQEISRILKPKGKLIIIDKDQNQLGHLSIEAWEQWFQPQELSKILRQHHLQTRFKIINDNSSGRDYPLFVAWESIKNE